ncbi:hypothetical protein BU26DRAFT_324856 [Trematosphaeria pertusa]|uniref:Uncharacterized protein n=1 Tax=Trematosphaeria pertusa TaxID=390896 RepID=A0A6A6IC60_9PLEO|nr:uncharacterized protein BU26DRAFT_324856 [Trematosphaeria pertusa]KAF2247971.1 hypothetical protein BU26DRAFT_324856 [Trematosphaeria pertusa]
MHKGKLDEAGLACVTASSWRGLWKGGSREISSNSAHSYSTGARKVSAGCNRCCVVKLVIICRNAASGSRQSGPTRLREGRRSLWLAGEPDRNFQKSVRKTASQAIQKALRRTIRRSLPLHRTHNYNLRTLSSPTDFVSSPLLLLQLL